MYARCHRTHIVTLSCTTYDRYGCHSGPLGLDPNGERRKLVHSSSTGSIRCRQPCCCM